MIESVPKIPLLEVPLGAFLASNEFLIAVKADKLREVIFRLDTMSVLSFCEKVPSLGAFFRHCKSGGNLKSNGIDSLITQVVPESNEI